MIKFTFTIEIDEETIRDIFDANDIKFSKAKLATLKRELKANDEGTRAQLEESFEEYLDELICELFE